MNVSATMKKINKLGNGKIFSLENKHFTNPTKHMNMILQKIGNWYYSCFYDKLI